MCGLQLVCLFAPLCDDYFHSLIGELGAWFMVHFIYLKVQSRIIMIHNTSVSFFFCDNYLEIRLNIENVNSAI